ncbi:hypothetical protein [Idiomarina abyssalis]|uniref:hypothetical protein n=1 Tax=Idiomarina abyssalis TaxID=86102 RepID=UPI003A93E023
MSLTIKKVLTSIDFFFGFLASILMRFFLYVFSFVFCVFGVVGLLISPFIDESNTDSFNFSFNELDHLEILVILTFVFTTIRFFKRSKSEGVSVWLGLKRYVFISAVIFVFYMSIFFFIFVALLQSQGDIAISDLDLYADLQYFSFCLLYLVCLYGFAPLPKLGWFSKVVKKESDPEVKKEAEPVLETTDFFTDSSENTYSETADNK